MAGRIPNEMAPNEMAVEKKRAALLSVGSALVLVSLKTFLVLRRRVGVQHWTKLPPGPCPVMILGRRPSVCL